MKQKILESFTKKSGIPLEMLENYPMQNITRPHLITLVEEWEKETGKTLQREENQPLGWLDENGVTLGDIADYFAGGSLKIAVIAKGISFEEAETFGQKVKKSLQELTKKGTEVTDDLRLSEILYDNLFISDYESAVYLVEEELKVILPAILPLDETSTVKDLVLLFIECKKF